MSRSSRFQMFCKLLHHGCTVFHIKPQNTIKPRRQHLDVLLERLELLSRCFLPLRSRLQVPLRHLLPLRSRLLSLLRSLLLPLQPRNLLRVALPLLRLDLFSSNRRHNPGTLADSVRISVKCGLTSSRPGPVTLAANVAYACLFQRRALLSSGWSHGERLPTRRPEHDLPLQPKNGVYH